MAPVPDAAHRSALRRALYATLSANLVGAVLSFVYTVLLSPRVPASGGSGDSSTV